MPSAVQDLLELLDLEPLEVNLFRGRSPQVGWQRVFGGQVIGQALVAACRTVEDDHGAAAALAARLFPARRRSQSSDHLRGGPHSRRQQLHHPQRQGDPARPRHLLDVGLIPPRRAGPDHQVADAGVPGPDDLPGDAEIRERVLPVMPDPVRRYYERERPIELRPLNSALSRQKVSARAGSTCGFAPPGRCRTRRRSTNACSRMRPT